MDSFINVVWPYQLVMSCIFASSKYYREARASPLDLAPPLGSDFLNSRSNKNVSLPSAGQLTMREVFDKPNHKVLSQKKFPKNEYLTDYFKISDVTRKNQFLPSSFIDFMRNEFSKELFLVIAKQFVPNWKPQYTMVELSQLLRNPRIDSITHIENYELSRFMFLCEGCDPWRMSYLHQFFNRRIIQYPVDCQVVNHNAIDELSFMLSPSQNTVFEPPADIQDVEAVRDLIRTINQKNSAKDPLYCGVHFYFADYREKRDTADYFERQILHLPLLQYYITVMTGVLANGQSAMIKLCGAFKHKTFEFLFLLKLMFNGKISIVKTLGSNPFLPDSYVICEYFNKENGDIIHNFLLENYHLVREFSDNKLMLDPMKILKEDMHTHLRNFNENIIHKGIQYHLKEFKSNSNIEYYPSKERITEKLPTFCMDLTQIVKDMVKLPDKSLIEKEKNDKIEQIKNASKIENAQSSGQKTSILSGGLFTKKKANPSSSTQKDRK